MESTDRFGSNPARNAAAPATCGVAMLVPLKLTYPVPGN